MSTVRLSVYDNDGFVVPGYAEVDILDLMRVVNVKLVNPEDAPIETEYAVFEFHIKTRGECEQVLTQMWDIAERYDSVSVSDLYDLVGIQDSFTDQQWGWRRKDLAKAKTQRTADGVYHIELPRAVSLRTVSQKG